MIKVTDKRHCCGCFACASVCPKQCISMVSDNEGFLYPHVDTTLCVNCNLCNRVCPVENRLNLEGTPQAYLFQSNNMLDRKHSSSGGAFTEIGKLILSNSGSVAGAKFNQDFVVVHDFADNYEKLKSFQGSKYVQSNIRSAYIECKKRLDLGQYVCFSGTPCQIAGLKSYLKIAGGGYNSLLTVDLVCHGVPSPQLFEKYKVAISKKGKIKNISFREKSYGYAGSTMAIEYESGAVDTSSELVKSFKKAYFSGIASRPICYNCPFKTNTHISDLTLFDCWHMNQFDPTHDDDKGTTAILVHSNNGEKLISLLKEKNYVFPIDYKELLELDGKMILESDKEHLYRAEFFKDSKTMDWMQLVHKYIPLTAKDRIVAIIKPLFSKLGLIKFFKRNL